MTDYFIIRLGADSEPEIKKIDSYRTYSLESFPILVNCRQVPKDLSRGDVAIIWLGTNNNKGTKTPWIQGVRAIGRIEDVRGSAEYGSEKAVHISVGLVLPHSITKMDIVTQQSFRYPRIAAMPVLGVNNYSSQVVQRIEPSEPGQDISALFATIDAIIPGLQAATRKVYPDLAELFEENKEPQLFHVYDNSHSLNLSVSTHPRRSVEEDEEDADGLEPDDERDSEIEVPFDPSRIDIIAKPMTVSSLEGRLENNELDLTPDFQRQANVWDVRRKARLIESILLKIPLPSFYFSEDKDGGYAVVDGLQRLCAIFHFKNASLLSSATGVVLPPLRLKGLQYLKELDGKSYSELDRKFQRRISELEIAANIIRANTPSAVKFNVFARLNQGGMPLNAQEIRNAIFPGEWRNELRQLAESDSFISATEKRIKKDRQQDMELVLRFIALWQLGSPFQRPPNQTLDEFLNTTVENSLVRWPEERWREACKAFYGAVEVTRKIRGRHAFRKSAGSQQRNPINRGLFEAELIVFGSLSADEIDYLTKHRTRFEELFVDALNNDAEFIQSMSSGTGSADAANTRISTITKIVKGVQGA